MKKLFKILSLVLAPALVFTGVLVGCGGKKVDPVVKTEGLLADKDVEPTATAVYEEDSAQALEDYYSVAERHLVDGEVDTDNEEVISAACTAAAKLYAYACYNERYLDKYVYFGDQTGTTDLGSSGAATAERQEYYLRVNETDETCGYRYHYTIKKVLESSGMVKTFKSSFESARLRFTDKTSLLYRFEGDNITLGDYDDNLGCDLLACDWATGDDWGKEDVQMIKGDYIAPEDIEADIVANADAANYTIRGNINILAENMVKYASISEDDEGGVNVLMTIDTDVANGDEASLTMLRNANGSSNCVWQGEYDEDAEGFGEDTGLRIVFRLWGNGLFRSYVIIERWTGKIVVFTGTAESQTTVYYSYSDYDCDMTDYLTMLESAKAAVG